MPHRRVRLATNGVKPTISQVFEPSYTISQVKTDDIVGNIVHTIGNKRGKTYDIVGFSYDIVGIFQYRRF